MSRKYMFSCDGCEAKEVMDADSFPNGWSDVKVTIEGVRNPYLARDHEWTGTFLLCGFCKNRLVDRCEPSSWPRIGNVEAA